MGGVGEEWIEVGGRELELGKGSWGTQVCRKDCRNKGSRRRRNDDRQIRSGKRQYLGAELATRRQCAVVQAKRQLQELGILLSLSVERRTIALEPHQKALQSTLQYVQSMQLCPPVGAFSFTSLPISPPTRPGFLSSPYPPPWLLRRKPHSSLSFPAAFLLSACSSSIRPVTGRWRTASGPQMVSNPLWKVHSTAVSTGLSKMKGRKGTAARPSCCRRSALAQPVSP